MAGRSPHLARLGEALEDGLALLDLLLNLGRVGGSLVWGFRAVAHAPAST
jgi:hypothetical protein